MPWGRVADDGTVYVRTADGERSVGSYEAGTPGGGAGVLHQALRRAGGQGPPARAARRIGAAGARGGDLLGEGAARAGRRRARGGRPRLAGSPPRRARPGDRGPAQRPQGGARAEERGVQGGEGEAGRRGREAGRGHRLAQRRQPAARPPRDVEGAAATRPGHRRRAVAALLHRADDVHPAPQGALRRGARASRRRAGRQGAAGHGGRGAVDVDRVGSDGRQVPRPDARVEGRRSRAPRGRRQALAALPRRPGHLLRCPRRRQRGPRRGVRRQRGGQGGDPRRGREAPPGHRRRRARRSPSATSPTAGTRPARCRATG